MVALLLTRVPAPSDPKQDALNQELTELSIEEKISELGVSVVIQGTPDEERIVERPKFPDFVLRSMVLKPLVLENAEIELVSPVLKEGKYRWKGIFNEEPIGFEMQDNEFRAQVLNDEITFQHGTWIECVLSVGRKLDEAGEVVITGYAVKTVIHKHDERQSVLTSSGRTYLHAKKMSDNQGDLLAGEN